MDRRTLFGIAALAPIALATSANASGGGGEGGGNQPSFTRMPTITATIVRPDGRRGVMTVEVGVDAPDPALRTRVAQSQPRLSSAYNTAVARLANGMRPGFAPDVEALVRDLQAATNATLGRQGGRVLIGTVMVA
ncbi:MAG: Tat pathway signal protein [Brevundimonas sp.]|nr:MAG: Tat pathway signal protein [Brevundimonas sp.]